MLKKSCKNVLAGAMLLASLAMLLNACGSDKQAAATQPKTTKVEEAAAAVAKVPAYEREYGKLVEGIYNFVNDGNMDKVPQQGMTGIYELRDRMGYVDALNMLGYTLQDINNDKVPELIFAILDNEKQGKGYYGKDIYAVYTFVDGKIKFVDEGWARSNLQLLANNMLLTRGNSRICCRTVIKDALICTLPVQRAIMNLVLMFIATMWAELMLLFRKRLI